MPTASALDGTTDSSTTPQDLLFARLWAQVGQRLGGWAALKDAGSGRYLQMDPALSAMLRPDGPAMTGAVDANASISGANTDVSAPRHMFIVQE